MAELPLIKEEKGLLKGVISPQEARYYKKLSDGGVHCLLCHHQCKIPKEEAGFCKVRRNVKGILYTEAFSNPCAVYTQPIEEEPFYHFLPGSMALYIATAGCNFRCKFCQNWLISQFVPNQTMNYYREPEDILELARLNGCSAINYTYTEPTIFFEYILEVAELAKKAGIKNICHSNGYMSEDPLLHICRYLDAICIDLKSFKKDFYKKICKADLDVVLNNLKIIKEQRIHLEIVTLVIPSINDDLEIIRSMCDWIVNNLSPDIPLHFLQFHPRYELEDLDVTSIDILEKARDIAISSGINFSYISNILTYPNRDTFCPRCKKSLIIRKGYIIEENNIVNGYCRFCGMKTPGYWGS